MKIYWGLLPVLLALSMFWRHGLLINTTASALLIVVIGSFTAGHGIHYYFTQSIKGVVQPFVKILSPFTYPHVIPSLCGTQKMSIQWKSVWFNAVLDSTDFHCKNKNSLNTWGMTWGWVTEDISLHFFMIYAYATCCMGQKKSQFMLVVWTKEMLSYDIRWYTQKKRRKEVVALMCILSEAHISLASCNS